MLYFVLAILPVVLFAFQNLHLDFAGWSSGFSHPLTGWDHLVTMLAVGIWAAQLRGHAIWMLPLAFVGVMSLGGFAGTAGLSIPSVEGIILLSCAVFSLLILRRTRFSTQVNVMIVAFFAFFHGFAHGQEISTSASLISYTFGFMLATLLLHGAGILVAKLVVLSVTCLIAVFLSSIAQANYAESESSSKHKNSHQVLNLGNSRFSPLLLEQYNEIERKADRLDTERMAKNCSSAFSENQLQSRKGFADSISSYGKVAADLPKISLKRATDDCHNCLNSIIQLYDVIRLNVENTDFRRYYPLINHTPGRDLLSNGVGLTSPPALFDDLFVSNHFQFKRNPSNHSFFEAFLLQVALAEIQFGIPSAIKTNNPSGSLLLPINLGEAEEKLSYFAHSQSTSSPLTHFCSNLLRLGNWHSSDLDLLFVHKANLTPEVTPAPAFILAPLTTEKFHAK